MIYQLITSFIVGGSVIALLTILAEKASEQVAGIIMMMPSTIVLGYFFLGLATSAVRVTEIIPATLVPLGIVILSSVFYIAVAKRLAKLIHHKILQIMVTLLVSSIIWFVLAAPFALWRINNLLLGIAGYGILAALAHYLLNRATVPEPRPAMHYTRLQILFRAVFIGLILALVVFLGKTLGLFWGGVFTMYPAVTFGSLVIFHFYYRPEHLHLFFKRAPLGSLSVFLYAITAMLVFPRLGLFWGTGISYCICLVFSLLLIRRQKRKVEASP